MRITWNNMALYTICYYLFSVTFFLDGSLGIKISRLAVLALYIAICSIKKGFSIRINGYSKWVLIFAIYSALTCFFSYNKNLAIDGTQTLIINAITLICIADLCRFIDKDVLAVSTARIISISSVIFGFWIFGQYGFNVFYESRFIETTGFNSNTLGQHTAIGAVLAYFLFYQKTYKLKNKGIYILVFGINLLFTILSGSRKSFFYVIIPLLMWYLLNSRSYNKILKRLFVAILIFICFWVSVMNVPFLYNSVGYRLDDLAKLLVGSGTGDASTSFRFLLIKWGFDWFKEKPLFGYGADNFRALVGMLDTWAGPAGTYAHNNFIELLVDFGAVGFVIYYSLYFKIVSKIGEIRKEKNATKCIFFSLFITMWLCEYGVVSYFEKFAQALLVIFWYLICYKDKTKGE